MNTAWIVVLAVGIALLQAFIYRKLAFKGVYYKRGFSRDSAYEGEAVEFVEVIGNQKPLPLPWVRVESRISPNLRFMAEDGEREIAADQYHKSLFFLGAYRQITRRHRVSLHRRGYYPLTDVALSAGDILGLDTASEQLSRPCAISVYPRLLTDEELGDDSTRWQGEALTRRFIMPDPFLTSGVRDYEIGDPIAYIHWKASAKLNVLQVKVRDYTADPRVMVALNVQTSEDQWGELNDDEQRIVEHGLRVAATLCHRALMSGVEAGFASNGCLYGEKGLKRPVILPSARGQNQFEALMEAMARLVIHREFTFPTFLEGLFNLTGEDIVILTAYESDELTARARALRARGNSVSFIRLRQEDVC